MCLIISSPADAEIRDEILRDAFTYNRDGWGVMWHNPAENRVEVRRGFLLNDLIAAVRESKSVQRHVLVHLRMATHGTVSLANTHPFEIGSSGIMMMHNGVIPGAKFQHPTKSDTALFIEMITNLAETAPMALHDEAVKEWLSGVVHSKLAFMTPEGSIDYIGEENQWIPFEKNYMSNTYAWSLWRGDGYHAYRGWEWDYYNVDSVDRPAAAPTAVVTPAKTTADFDAWYQERYEAHCMEEQIELSPIVSKGEDIHGYVEIYHQDGLIGLAELDMDNCYFYEHFEQSGVQVEPVDAGVVTVVS